MSFGTAKKLNLVTRSDKNHFYFIIFIYVFEIYIFNLVSSQNWISELFVEYAFVPIYKKIFAIAYAFDIVAYFYLFLILKSSFI